MPSIRGSYSELYLFAQIFNESGYNVFTVEPRFATVDTNDFNMRYLYLKLDGLRAIRYIRSNAEELEVDPDRMITLGGSKGNGIHSMVACNNHKDCLYDIVWEMHICDKATHGYGAGAAVIPVPAYSLKPHDPLLNIRAMWRELDAFLQINLIK